ncbi:MAG: DNA double-strand break repair nuclease NurA [Candidatus Helarchaeota archaeon]
MKSKEELTEKKNWTANSFDFVYDEGLMEKAKKEAKKIIENYTKFLENVKNMKFEYNPIECEEKFRKIAALDGGEGLENLFASSIIVTRAGGAVFEPSKRIQPVKLYDMFISSLTADVDKFSNLLRDIAEFKLADQLLDYKPEILIMDGSLVGYYNRGLPLQVLGYLNVPTDEKPILEYIEQYKNYAKLFDKILKRCRKENIIIMGVSKDSRVRYLVNKYKLDKTLTDYGLIQLKMKKSGYTPPIQATPRKMGMIRRDAIQEFFLKEGLFEEDLAEFQISYFKLKDRTRPVRVDFPTWQEDRFDEIVSVMKTYHDDQGFLLTAHLVHNWAVMNDEIKTNVINVIKSEILESDPMIYEAIFSDQRRMNI